MSDPDRIRMALRQPDGKWVDLPHVSEVQLAEVPAALNRIAEKMGPLTQAIAGMARSLTLVGEASAGLFEALGLTVRCAPEPVLCSRCLQRYELGDGLEPDLCDVCQTTRARYAYVLVLGALLVLSVLLAVTGV